MEDFIDFVGGPSSFGDISFGFCSTYLSKEGWSRGSVGVSTRGGGGYSNDSTATQSVTTISALVGHLCIVPVIASLPKHSCVSSSAHTHTLTDVQFSGVNSATYIAPLRGCCPQGGRSLTDKESIVTMEMESKRKHVSIDVGR